MPIKDTFRYKLIKQFTKEKIFDLIDRGKKVVRENKNVKNVSLKRAIIFKKIGCDCVSCNRKGTFFAIGIDKGGHYHLDLYGNDSDGKLFGMTIDHIKPKSKGGANDVSNYQPMCKKCNETKADNWTEPIVEKKSIIKKFIEFILK